MDEDQKHYFKVAIGCILGMIAVLAVLTYLNSSDIIKLSIQVDQVKSSVELFRCNTDHFKPECSSDYKNSIEHSAKKGEELSSNNRISMYSLVALSIIVLKLIGLPFLLMVGRAVIHRLNTVD